MTRLHLLICSAFALLLIGCGDNLNPTASREKATAVQFARQQATHNSAAPAATYWTSQKLIRTAELRIEVANVRAAAQTADSLARESGALVTESRTTQDAQQRHEAQLVVRVPSEHLAATLLALRRLGDVQEEAISTQDVTKEYADLDTRLAVKEQTVARLRSLIETRTAKLAEVLEVERELARAVTELEEMKGARRYYDQQIALSTIKLGLVDHAVARSGQLTGPLRAAFHGSLDVLGTSLSGVIYLITFLLPWMVIVIPVWWVAQRWRTRGKRA